LTLEAARAQVCREHEDLYQRYREESQPVQKASQDPVGPIRDVQDTLRAKMEALVASGLTPDQAYSQVMRDNPTLAEELSRQWCVRLA
jgi:hypothetical protein